VLLYASMGFYSKHFEMVGWNLANSGFASSPEPLAACSLN